MDANVPTSIVWLRRIILFQLFTGILYILFLLYLAFAQPTDGWRSGIQLGFLEGLKGFSSHQEVVYFTPEEAGYASSPIFISSLLNGIMLFTLKKKRIGILKGTVVLRLLYALVNRVIPFLEIIMLVLIFNKTSRAFFKEKVKV